jgi:hypothetical protein
MEDFEFEETRFKKDLEKTYMFAQEWGLPIIRSKLVYCAKNEVIRRPLGRAEEWDEEFSRESFKKLDSIDELIPTLLIGKSKYRADYIVVIDVDVKKNKNGLKTIQEKFPELLHVQTIAETTASGGKHLYFKTKKKLRTHINAFHGIDLLANQEGNRRLLFCPPALGKDLKARHEWDDGRGPGEIILASLPKDFEELWSSLKQAPDRKHVQVKTETIDDYHTFQKIIPQAIERATTRDGEAIDATAQKKLDEFMDTLSVGNKWQSGCCRNAWLQLGYLTHKLDVDEEKQFTIFHTLSKLMPDYEDEEECRSTWYSLHSPRSGGTLATKIRKTVLVQEEWRIETEEQLSNLPFMEEQENEKDISLKEKVDTIDKKVQKILKEKEKTNLLFRLAKVVNTLYEDNTHPIAGFLVATSIVSAALQYEYSFKVLKHKGAASLNTFTGIFACSGSGKQIFFDVYNRMIKELGIMKLDEAKSTIGLFRQVSGKKISRDFVLLIDEIKSEGGFLLKKGTGSMDASLKKAHTKLYDGELTGWVSKTENEGTLYNTYESLFFASAFDEFSDEFIRNIDAVQGIGNRPLFYIAEQRAKQKEKELSEEYFCQGDDESQIYETILDTFCQRDLPQLKKLMNRGRDEPRKVYYERQYPCGIAEDGNPSYELITLGEGTSPKKKKAEEVKKEQETLKRLINETDPYQPQKLVLDSKGAEDSFRALEEAYKEQSEDDFTKRKRLHVIKLSALIELCEDRYQTQTPETVSFQSVKTAKELVSEVFNSWIIQSEKHVGGRDDITYQEKSESSMREKVRKKITRQLAKHHDVSWAHMKGPVHAFKEIRLKDNFLNYIRSEFSEEFVIEYSSSGHEILRKKQ